MPHKFFNANYGEPLRAKLAEGKHLSEIVHFGDQQVFTGATTYTCLLFINKYETEVFNFFKVMDLEKWQFEHNADHATLLAADMGGSAWNFSAGENRILLEKLKQFPMKLGEIAHIFVGTQTSADDVFVLDKCRIENGIVMGFSKSLNSEVKVEATCTKPFLRGKQIRRYEQPQADARLICPYEINESSSRLYADSEMKDHFPLAWEYLCSNKSALAAREKGRFCGSNWFAFGYPKSMTLFSGPKIIVPDYNNVPSFTFDIDGYFYKTGYGVIANHKLLSPLYILGLLNSPLLFKYLCSIGTSLRGGYIRFWTQFIEQLPIRNIDFSDPADAALHDHMVSLVEQMLSLHKRYHEARTPHEQTALQRQIEATDGQIDDLVYKLYELTEEEKNIVERDNA